MVWYPYLFKSFPQFVMIYTVKGFSVVDGTDVDVFLEFKEISMCMLTHLYINIYKYFVCNHLNLYEAKHEFTLMSD